MAKIDPKEALQQRLAFGSRYTKIKLWNEAAMCEIPDYMRPAIVNYVFDAKPVGGFLTLLLCKGSWIDVLSAADYQNKDAIQGWGRFLYNYAPACCWGSREVVDAWLATRELEIEYANSE